MHSNAAVKYKEYNSITTPINCVIGCLSNNRGLQILDELLSWVQIKYHVYVVYQEYPGVLFEYPALYYAKQISLRQHKPVLYLHTKGAYNDNPIQNIVRALWWKTFFVNYNRCCDELQRHDVICPFTGSTKMTWYNGFIASESAFSNVNIQIESDRYIYEGLWRHRAINPSTDVYGLYDNTLNTPDDMSKRLAQKWE